MSTRRPSILVRSIASLVLLSTGAVAADWVGGTSTDWNTGSNWSGGVVPAKTANEDAVINTKTPNPTAITADLAAIPRDIIVGDGAGTNGLVNHSAGTAQTGDGNWAYIGEHGGTGVYNLANTATTGGSLTGFGLGSGSLVAGGTNAGAGRLYVGASPGGNGGGSGTFNMNTSGTLTVRNDLSIGTNGATGVMKVDAGTITTGGWNFIGREEGGNANGNGTLNMSGGSLTNGGERTFLGLGNSVGAIVMSGGTYNNQSTGGSTQMAIGVQNTGNATPSSVTMTGGTINANNLFTIGGNESFGGDPNGGFLGAGKGQVTISGASALLNVTGQVWVGQAAGSTGTLNVSAGNLTTNNWIAVGRNGATGNLNLSGGTITKTGGGEITIGTNGGNGTITQTGGSLIAVGSGDMLIGEGGTAKWSVTGNGIASVDAIRVSASGAATTTGNLTIGGNASVTGTTLLVSEAGTGSVNMSGGTLTLTAGGDSRIAATAGNTGTFTLSGGTVSLQSNFQIGASGIGTLTQTGGVVNAASYPSVGRFQGATGNLTISAGAFNQVTAGTVLIVGEEGTGTLALSGTGTVSVAGGLNIGQNATGNGTVNQSGGTLSVGGLLDLQNLGTGKYNLSGGTLAVDGSVDTSNGLFNFTGGKLTRSSAGTVTINGNLTTSNAAATFKLDANKNFDINGTFDKTIGLTLEIPGLVIPAYSGTGIKTGTFTLGTVDAIIGTFNPATDFIVGLTNTPNATFISETAGENSTYNANTQNVYWVQADNAGNVTLKYSIVPEPSTAGLLALGTLLCGVRRRRVE